MNTMHPSDQSFVPREQDQPEVTDTANYEIIAETPMSMVYRVESTIRADQPRVVKVCNPEFTPEPHDICKEISILSRLSHPNIISFLGQDFDDKSYRLWMPYIPHPLKSLLNCPRFAPSPYYDGGADDEFRFIILTKSIFYQTLQALEYLHHPTRLIAHRDIKPGNILLTRDCQVKLIDFGIAWESRGGKEEKGIWNESSENMYTEVATGPYRSPELLFGPKSYDAIATDKWSLGCTFAEFFTPLRLVEHDTWGNDDEDDTNEISRDDQGTHPFIIPTGATPSADTYWERIPLFDADRGEIGLAWSIFKVRGTPNQDNWPGFNELPHSTRVTFTTVPSVDLHRILPNLPSNLQSKGFATTTEYSAEHIKPSPVDLITRLLAYPPASRISCKMALKHPWFSQEDVPLLFPTADGADTVTVWKGRELGDLLYDMFKPNVPQ